VGFSRNYYVVAWGGGGGCKGFWRRLRGVSGAVREMGMAGMGVHVKMNLKKETETEVVLGLGSICNPIRAVNIRCEEIIPTEILLAPYHQSCQWSQGNKLGPATCSLIDILVNLSILGELNKIFFPLQQPLY